MQVPVPSKKSCWKEDDPMTDIIFSFDTEDFTSAYAADAVYEEAEILRKEGVKGGFCLVGLFAQQLQNWGKSAIMEALQHHVIGNHSYGHTLHPTINEYTDLEDFDEAQKECLRQETESGELIKKAVSGKPLVFGCPPGNQKSYVAMYTYADLGYPIYADTYCDTPDGDGMFYCNIYQTRYTYMLESSFKKLNTEEGIREILDQLATKKRAIIYHHPHYALVSECWDVLNYKKENLRPFGQWEECKRREPEVTQNFYAGLKRLIQMIKADPRFRITNYEELAEELAQEQQRVVGIADIPSLSASLQKEFFPVTDPCSLSISDMFLACRDLLLGKTEHICGKVYGFLAQPAAITEAATLSREEMIRSAEAMDVSRFLPDRIKVGSQEIGPGDWLRAAMEVLKGAETVTIQPGPQLPSLDCAPSLRDCDFTKYRWMQSDDFQDNYLSERLRLQAWTMRFLKK